jgi:tetratricopeptide (TPR) repeat protein
MSNYDLDLDYAIPVIDISKEQLNRIIAEADKIISDSREGPAELAIACLKKAQCLQKLEEYPKYTGIENIKAGMADVQRVCIGTQNQIKTIVEKSLELIPDMPEALMQMGKIYHKLFKSGNAGPDEAINMYTRAIQLKPDYAAAYSNRGTVYASKIYSRVKSGNYQENLRKAIADFTHAIRLRPFEAIYYLKRGKQYSELREHKKAIADFSESLRLRPDISKVLLFRGQEYLSAGKKDKAKADFDEYLRCKRSKKDT